MKNKSSRRGEARPGLWVLVRGSGTRECLSVISHQRGTSVLFQRLTRNSPLVVGDLTRASINPWKATKLRDVGFLPATVNAGWIVSTL